MKLFLLSILLFLSFLIRFSNIETKPPLTVEEMKVGLLSYDAIHTDKFFSIPFEKTTYVSVFQLLTTIPFILGGVSAVTLRLPAVLMGVIHIFLFYTIVQKLLDTHNANTHKMNTIFPFLAALGLAITPWHIQLSRINSPQNVGISLFLIIFYIGILTPKLKHLILLLSSSMLLMFTHPSFFILGYMCFVALIVKYYSFLLQKKSVLFAVLAVFIVTQILVPKQYWNYFLQNDELKSFLINSKHTEILNRNAYRPTLLSSILFTSPVEQILLFAQDTFSYLEIHQLFSKWDRNVEFITSEHGLWYLVDVAFLMGGIWVIYKKERRLLLGLIMGLFFLISGTTLRHSVISPLQITPVLLVVSFIILVGQTSLLRLQKKKQKKLLIGLCLLYGVSFARFYYLYLYSDSLKVNELQKSYLQVMDYLSLIEDDKVIVFKNGSNTQQLRTLHLFTTLQKKHSISGNTDKKHDSYTFDNSSEEMYQPHFYYVIPATEGTNNLNTIFTSDNEQSANGLRVVKLNI